MPNYHFEDDQVMTAIVGTDYLKGNVRRHLNHMTSGEKWSLYRAIVKLAAEQTQAAQAAAYELVRKLDDAALVETWRALLHNQDDGNGYHGLTYAQWKEVVRAAVHLRGLLSQPGRTLFACQKCGEEVGDGEDHNGRHANCGGSLDPIGEVPED